MRHNFILLFSLIKEKGITLRQTSARLQPVWTEKGIGLSPVRQYEYAKNESIKAMPDRMTKEQRHRCMAAIRGKGTKPELLVRKYLFSRGFRYRLNHPRLPGHPDIVLRKYRTCIFVNGCFWHGHDGCRHFVIPKTNTGFWKAKIERNKARDKEEQRRLAAMGWHCITVWECQLKPAVRERTLESLAYTLNRIFLNDHSTRRYRLPDDECAMVAEPEPARP